jgi:hypothetical protein
MSDNDSAHTMNRAAQEIDSLRSQLAAATKRAEEAVKKYHDEISAGRKRCAELVEMAVEAEAAPFVRALAVFVNVEVPSDEQWKEAEDLMRTPLAQRILNAGKGTGDR